MLQPSIVSVTPLANTRLLLEYADGQKKTFDVRPYTGGPWYGELKNVSYFNSVSLLEGGRGIEWPHGQDISPHELYEQGEPVDTTS